MKNNSVPATFSIILLVCLCLVLFLSECKQTEDEVTEHKRADDVEHSYNEGCDANAATVCATYYRCTGMNLDHCLSTVCDQLDETARQCILAVQSCEEIRQCLPQQGDDGIFEEDDDDDTGDDDDATEEELLKNKDFDLGPTSVWSESSSGGYDLIQHQDEVSETDAQTPGYLVYLGGYNNAVDVLYQTVLLPAGVQSATISCYVKIISYETGTEGDLMKVRLQDSGGTNLIDLDQYSNLDTVDDWSLKTWEATVSSWGGNQVRFAIEVTTNATNSTSYFVDTCSFKVTN